MSRERKFRAWDAKAGLMVYFGMFDHDSGWVKCTVVPEGHEDEYTFRGQGGVLMTEYADHVVDLPIMDWISATDVDGNDLYEDDILEFFDPELSEALVRIVWAPEHHGWGYEYLGDDSQYSPYPLSQLGVESYRRTGNLHENPELLT